jgi:hypothetical protein
MPTKSELEDQMNDRLDMDIEWSEMKKTDLAKLRDGLEDERFVKKVVAQYANDMAGDTVEDQIDGWQPGQALSILGELQSGESNPADILYNL